MGHVGLTPQTSTALGGWKAQGRTASAAARIAAEALALQEAGCFAIVFEAIPAAVTEELMPHMEVPVIGIGAGPATDGQVLVFHDLLGIRDGLGPRFVKRYAYLQEEMNAGVAAYAEDVRAAALSRPGAHLLDRPRGAGRAARAAGLTHRPTARAPAAAGRPCHRAAPADPRTRSSCSTLAGVPAASEKGSMSCVTTLLAPITQRSPMLTPLVTTTLAPSQQLSPMRVGPLRGEALPRDGPRGIVVAVARVAHEAAVGQHAVIADLDQLL